MTTNLLVQHQKGKLNCYIMQTSLEFGGCIMFTTPGYLWKQSSLHQVGNGPIRYCYCYSKLDHILSYRNIGKSTDHKLNIKRSHINPHLYFEPYKHWPMTSVKNVIITPILAPTYVISLVFWCLRSIHKC